jgi:hypothetical protein
MTGAGILESVPSALAEPGKGRLTRGDAAILRWLAAAEIIESDLWLQYQELAGIQDDEVANIASQQIPGYPAQATVEARLTPPLSMPSTKTCRCIFTTTPKMN